MDNRKFQAAASASPPAAEATPSTGYPTDGNPAGGTPATIPGAFWFHQIGEEQRNAVLENGLTPDSSDLTQLSKAISIRALDSGLRFKKSSLSGCFVMVEI